MINASLLTPGSFRHIGAMMVPSAIAVAPWVYRWCEENWEYALNWIDDHWAIAATVLVMGSVLGGFILENIGSWLEFLFDKLRSLKTNSTHEADWERYLRTAFHVEPVGQNYIRTILIRFKFELAMAVACISATLGAWYVLQVQWLTIVISIFTTWMLTEAWISHGLLARTRRKLTEIDGIHYCSPPPANITSDTQESPQDSDGPQSMLRQRIGNPLK